LDSSRGLSPFGPTLRHVILDASQTSFAAAESLPQRTTNSITETPGKVVVHVRIPNVKIEAAAAYYLISQWTNKTKTSIGVDTTYEAISIAHVVTDEDGSLKIKQIEQFVDSKAYLDSLQAFAAAKAKK